MIDFTNLIMLASGVFLTAIVFFAVYFLFSAKKQKGGSIFLKISEEFEEQVESLILNELKQTIIDLNKQVQLFNQEMSDNYKKEVASFFRGAEGELAKISKVNKEIQYRLKQDVEEKMAEFDSGYAQAKDSLFQEARKRTAELGKSLSGEASHVYESTEKMFKERSDELKKDIENYKKQRIEELDKEIFRVIGAVARNTIGKTIDLSTHEELVMEALEKAKKEHIF